MKPPRHPTPPPMLGVRQAAVQKLERRAEVPALMEVAGVWNGQVSASGDKEGRGTDTGTALASPGPGPRGACVLGACGGGGEGRRLKLGRPGSLLGLNGTGTHKPREALGRALLGLEFGGAGEGGVDVCHYCGRDTRQDAGEPGPIGSLLPDSPEVRACVRASGGDRARPGQVTWLARQLAASDPRHKIQ